MRYKIVVGKFGAYFFDVEKNMNMTLRDVKKELNKVSDLEFENRKLKEALKDKS